MQLAEGNITREWLRCHSWGFGSDTLVYGGQEQGHNLAVVTTVEVLPRHPFPSRSAIRSMLSPPQEIRTPTAAHSQCPTGKCLSPCLRVEATL